MYIIKILFIMLSILTLYVLRDDKSFFRYLTIIPFVYLLYISISGIFKAGYWLSDYLENKSFERSKKRNRHSILKLQTNYLSIGANYIALLIFCFISHHFFQILFSKNDIFIQQIVGIAILLIVVVIFYKFKQRIPFFLTLTESYLITRGCFYLDFERIPLQKIKGFSSIKVIYTSKNGIRTKYDAIMFYLENKEKKLVIEYNFYNFYGLHSNLKKLNVNYFGVEDKEWSVFRKSYKFDEKESMNAPEKLN